jgi:hypothetical protein
MPESSINWASGPQNQPNANVAVFASARDAAAAVVRRMGGTAVEAGGTKSIAKVSRTVWNQRAELALVLG